VNCQAINATLVGRGFNFNVVFTIVSEARFLHSDNARDRQKLGSRRPIRATIPDIARASARWISGIPRESPTYRAGKADLAA
jgi:hypothetical protein